MHVCYMVSTADYHDVAKHWTSEMIGTYITSNLQLDLSVGLSLEFFNARLMFLFDDSKALDEHGMLQ